MSRFPFIKQFDSQDCGIACLKMIAEFYGINESVINEIVENTNIQRNGISISELEAASHKIGFSTMTVKLTYEEAENNIVSPSIFFWNQKHFIVVYKITKNRVYVADPAFGKVVYTKTDFLKGWTQGRNEGIITIVQPTEKLYESKEKNHKPRNYKFLINYLLNHRLFLYLLSFTLLLSSCIELIVPFFTKTIIDKGVANRDINLIYLILIAQVTIFLSKISLEFYRSWLFIHISSRISLSIISDFLRKLMKLPIKFFTTRNLGDLLQRIQDHKRIEEFLSKDLIQSLFSVFSILIFGLILFYFNKTVFLIVFFGTALELIWVFSFLRKVRLIDKKMFALNSIDQNKIYELITSIQDIKLNNIEDLKREEWQKIQTNIYYNNIDKLKINQRYESYRFISFFQNILVIFVSAMAIINNTMTIGTMLSIMYIIGGMNGPISSLITFVMQFELVKVSFDRLSEIHNKEEEISSQILDDKDIDDISLAEVSFSYDNKKNILSNINLQIPKGKTTAIVGVSGSGKTTLLKILLKFYNPKSGEIKIGTDSLLDIDNRLWRSKCGVILQDSFIFSDTIAFNIALEKEIDLVKLKRAINLANISEFVNQLALRENTIIGADGISISHGQKQRILIARIIYKNPDYIFFDEATNSLDANNEKIIVKNINDFFKNKTMIVVAHRLSTVKNADQIVVIEAGNIIEKGTHQELISLRGKYHELIHNQLELGE